MSPFVFVFSTPTLIPSIIFSILFLFTSCLLLYRIIQTRRFIYIILFIFSFLRATLFIIRIAWSLRIDSGKLAMASGILNSGAFFLIVLSVYILLKDWINTLSQITFINNSNSKYEQYTIKIIEILLPALSILFMVGSIKEFDTDEFTTGDSLIKFSIICFLVSVTFYMVLVTYFALKYSNKPFQLKVLVLYIVGALLLIELVYGTFMIFSQSTERINHYSWVFYVFEPLPEVLILAILGGVILGEWFFTDDDIELVDSIKAVSIGSAGNEVIHV